MPDSPDDFPLQGLVDQYLPWLSDETAEEKATALITVHLILKIEEGAITDVELYDAVAAHLEKKDLRKLPVYKTLVQNAVLVDGESSLHPVTVQGIMWAVQKARPPARQQRPRADSGDTSPHGQAAHVARRDEPVLTHDGDWDHGLVYDEANEIAEDIPPDVLWRHAGIFEEFVAAGALTVDDLSRAVDAYYHDGDLQRDPRYDVLVACQVVREGEGRMRPAVVRAVQIALGRSTARPTATGETAEPTAET